MIGMTVCSGIGAPELASPWIDWRYQSEIEPFPCAVLKERFPNAVNLGDMTKFKEWEIETTIDVLCGGTPCQSFSIAGMRKGLDDPRGNLMLTYLAIAERYRPRWLVWENVPGVLSSNGGRDFGALLGGLGSLGYGFAYRVLDAQYTRTRSFPYAVPQRRRRVFVVGYLGDWRRAAAVLFDDESLRGNSPPRREAGQAIAALTANGVGACGADDSQAQAGHLIANPVAPTLNAHFGDKMGLENQHIDGGCGLFVSHSLRGEGFDASEDGTGRGTPIVPVAFDCKGTQVQYSDDGSHPPLRSMGHHHSHQNAGGHAAIATPWAVRRLTPTECERLMGFPDGWTQIPWRKKDAENCPDGPRYKALGNSWAVNCGEYVFDSIKLLEKIGASTETNLSTPHHQPEGNTGKP